MKSAILYLTSIVSATLTTAPDSTASVTTVGLKAGTNECDFAYDCE